MAMTNSTLPELLWPGILEIFGTSYNDWPAKYPKVFETMNSDKAFEKMQGLAGFGLAGLKTQGASVQFSAMQQGFQKEFVHATYGIGCVITREMMEDEQYNQINKIPAMLARSMRQTEETLAFSVLNNHIDTNYTLPDGLPLASTAHIKVGGGTFANRPTSAADLTHSALETAVMSIHDFTDDMGLKIYAEPKLLIIPTAVEMQARRILNSTQVAGTADNDVNPIKSIVDILVVPWLTDADTWYITTTVPNGLIWMSRRKVEASRDNEFDTENLKFKTTARFSYGAVDPRGIWCVPGA